jgi:signal peptidase
MLEKITENRVFKTIGTVAYSLLVVFVLAILLVVVLQRVSNNNISLGGFRIFSIITESMVPKYKVGDILLSKSIEPSKIKVGDDLVYLGAKDSFAGKVVTHQVIKIEQENGEYKFHTKGLANDIEDPVVSESQVYGKIICNIKVLGFINNILNNIYGFYFLIFIPTAILIITKIKAIYEEIKETRNETEEELVQDDENKKAEEKEEKD